MVQKALVERFGLRFHPGRKLLTAYVLSVDSGGLKIEGDVGAALCRGGLGSLAGQAPGEEHGLCGRGARDATHSL